MSNSRELGDLLEQIRLGEDSQLEFKRVVFENDKIKGPNGDSLSQEIAVFANAIGGRLILGVDDKTRDVVGIPLDRLDAVSIWLENCVHDRIKPEPTIYLRRRLVPDRSGTEHAVLVIDIPRSLYVHLAPGGYFRRQGSSKHELPPNELLRLMQSRQRAGTLGFDEMPVLGCTQANFDAALYGRFLGTTDEPEELRLRKLKLLVPGEPGEEWASVAGVLMATATPSDWLPQAYVQCVHYAGTEKTAQEQLDAQDIQGPLDQQIRQAAAFVLRGMRTAARKNLGRIDVPQFDPEAVFEAIANAGAHRDYSISGAPVQVHLFTDRLEITSPGALPNSQSVESIALRTATRNELLTNLLARCPVEMEGVGRSRVMEKRGEGVPQILNRSERLSGHRPKFELLGENALRVTLYAADPETSPLLNEAGRGSVGLPHAGFARDDG
ncbi:ATP-binding protein [Xanthomonas campestris pv. campestris]|uniref:ATP-binding protein n=1 Tax=Xanthomonas campestris TaxID=339 RepID=UPI002366DD39|nr:ATP-binding protein [Xanthomonas campestris]MEB1261241.1 ATP-binding protein [Xanthomonas campestris pv. campestris]MEB1323476.1 ATP-binding protein [Xanthomonas campestris pv. campestris]MEB1357205.1 ATP-binding protein [Xanthomonas campestris pv. campestris]MEB1424290.1 ATP-binding protein [Xanthomonas campestris pv. campestris]MEB1449243.1 ATP-binding protein [Xanthomonas campestris pv. campestris]